MVERATYTRTAVDQTVAQWVGPAHWDLEPEEEASGDRRAAKLGYVRLEDLLHDAYKPTRLVRYRRSGANS